MLIKYGNLNLLNEYDIEPYVLVSVLLLMSYTFVCMLNGFYKPIAFLPHMLFLISVVVISDINDERIKHNNRVLYDLLTGYNRVAIASRRAQSYVN